MSLRDEIDTELEAREKRKESRTPLDLFAQQARRDVCCTICGCHHYYDDGVHETVEQIMTMLFDADKTEGDYERFRIHRKIKKQGKKIKLSPHCTISRNHFEINCNKGVK